MNNLANIENLAAKLHQKQTELLADLAQLKSEAMESGESEVRDQTDDATAAQISSVALQEITLESRTLEQVEAALHRMDDGTYGNCTLCGKPIPDARLEAIPWTPYCLEDQEKQDAKPSAGTAMR